MHLYAIAPGYALKPATSVPTPIGPADHRQPTACALGPRRFQQPSSKSEARRPTSLPTQLSRPPGLDPTAPRPHRATPARQQAMPCRVPRYSSEILQRKLQQKNCYVWLQQCLRGAWRVRPNIRTRFVPQPRLSCLFMTTPFDFTAPAPPAPFTAAPPGVFVSGGYNRGSLTRMYQPRSRAAASNLQRQPAPPTRCPPRLSPAQRLCPHRQPTPPPPHPGP